MEADLERVRQAIRNGERAMIQLNWAADTWGCEADIDTHLKEDAEIWEQGTSMVAALTDQLTELREAVRAARQALNTAGDRLAQLQPAVTEPWAYDIVPRAEWEIAEADAVLRQLIEEKE